MRVYELEDVRKRADDTIDALVDHIYQIAHHALIGDGCDAGVEFEVQCRLIHAIPDDDIELGKELSRSVKTRVSHTYWKSAIHTMPLSLELLQCVLAKPLMQYRSPINLKSNHRSIPHSARIAHASTHLGMTIAPPKSLSAEVVQRKDIGKPSVIPARKNNPLLQWTANQNVCLVSMERRGKKADLMGVHTEEPPCDGIFLDNVCAPHINEAYTTVCLPASASSKGMASLQVKADTGASKNVLLL